MRQNLPVTGRNLELPKDANILSTTSPQSHITYVNPDFIKISGFTEEELLGKVRISHMAREHLLVTH
ncbi:PAS domain S-box protein [Aeromonas caviae]|uniref:PAS domain S-box protein n=1 Tax=Aeromonas caviae TaxID=648 RepID=UPI0038739F9E